MPAKTGAYDVAGQWKRPAKNDALGNQASARCNTKEERTEWRTL